MYSYTSKQVRKAAVDAARDVRRETGKRARLVDWALGFNDGGEAFLCAKVETEEGMVERNVAI